MKRLLLAILLTSTASQAAPPPITVTVSQSDAVNVRIDSNTAPAVTVAVPAGGDVLSIVTAGPQGIPGAPGQAGTPGAPGPGVPPGGATGQVLAKESGTDYRTIWIDPPVGPAAPGDYSWGNITDKPLVFPPDAHTQGIGTINGLQTALDGKETSGAAATAIAALPAVARTGRYPDLTDRPAIPQACVDVYDGRDGAPGATGSTGPAGPANSLAIGAVTTGNPGTDAAATITGTPPSQTLSLVIPRGEPGASASITQSAVLGVLDDPTTDAVLWVQQAVGEPATNAKSGTRDSGGNAKQWVDGNGTIVRQCITGDTAPAFKMLNPSGTVIYSVDCDNTMTFTGTVTIK